MKFIVLKAAKKMIDSQPPKLRARIIQAISQLPDGDVVPLRGKEGIMRLRVGEFRITYSVNYEEKTVTVRTAGPRGDIYKG